MTHLSRLAAFALAASIGMTSMAMAGGPILDLNSLNPRSDQQKVKLPPHLEMIPSTQAPIQPNSPLQPGNPKLINPNVPLLPWPGPANDSSGPHFDKPLLIACAVRAGETGDADLWLINAGNAQIPAGTRIRYAASGEHGGLLLNRTIPPDGALQVPDLLSGAEAGDGCDASII